MAGGLRVIQGGGFRQRKKANKIDGLKTELSIAKMANRELIERLKMALKVMKEFENESNWALKPNHMDDQAPGYLVWLGEGDPPTIVKAVLARIRGASAAFDEKVVEVEDKDSPLPPTQPSPPA